MQYAAKIVLVVAAAAMAYLLDNANILWLCTLVLFDWR